MKEKMNLKSLVIFAGAFISAQIGTAYASGQEQLGYFLAFGNEWWLILALFGVITVWATSSVLSYGYSAKVAPHIIPYNGSFRFICGKYLGIIMEILLPLCLLCVCVTMCSGAGSIFENYLGISHTVGVVIIAVFMFVSYMLGTRRLIDMLGFLGPVIIVFLILCLAHAISQGADWGKFPEILGTSINLEQNESNWFMSGINYALFSFGTCIPFYCAVGATAHSRKEAKWGAAIGGIALTLCTLLIVLANIGNLTTIWNVDMPTLQFALDIAPWFGVLFGIIMLIALYSTAAPMLWMIVEAVPEKKGWEKWQRKVLAAIVCLCIIFSGQLPFPVLVNNVYPILGYYGMIVAIAIIIRQIQFKVTGKDKELKEAIMKAHAEEEANTENSVN